MKKLIIAMMLVITTASFTACGNSSSSDSDTKQETTIAMTMDRAKEMCSELTSASVFADELAEITDAAIPAQYLGLSADDYEAITSYKGSGATAEEITVIQAKDGVDLNDKIKTYLDTQKKTYESYLPDEVAKIDAAITKQEGNFYTIVIAKDGDAAKKIVDKY